MNRLATWTRTVILGHRRNLTDAQIAGDACALCGRRFYDDADRADFGWIGLPFRRRAYACQASCVIKTVDDTLDLFLSVIPARQRVHFWHLGVDDVPLVSDGDGDDTVDRSYAAELGAQPTAAVEIRHGGGVLTTRPLPLEYAEQIAQQAQSLGFAATLSALRYRFMLEREVVTPDGTGVVAGISEKVVRVALADGREQFYPANFVEPREGFGAR